MRIPRLYTPRELRSGQTLVLEEQTAHYVHRVLRMAAGRQVILFNGRGGEFSATLTETGKKAVAVRVEEYHPVERESTLAIHLGIGISRGERMDWVLQKATELGVTAITPLFTERGEVRLKGERLQKKQQHWQQILISACEQCQRNRLPQLNAAVPLQQHLAAVQEPHRLVLHHRSESALAARQPLAAVALLIGPEGGLGDDEISLSEEHGFQALALGPRVLRTETAPVVAISILQYLWGDLS